MQAPAAPGRRRGRKPKAVTEFPEALTTDWLEPDSFHEALALHVSRHGDSICHLYKALTHQGIRVERSTLLQWAAGNKIPRSVRSLAILAKIEQRYRLPPGYFQAKLPMGARAATGHGKLKGIAASEQRRMAWHLPDDFDRRPPREREEILSWVRRVIISGSTDYRRFQAEASRHRYAVRFPEITGHKSQRSPSNESDESHALDDVEAELAAATMDAPRRLADELAELIRFKTATLTDIGFQRSGVWKDSTALQKVEHLGLLFGALTAPPSDPVKGFGLPRAALTMGLLVFPAVWDWYVQWRERRREFYTVWEVNMLHLGMALTRTDTGWLRQSPGLARHLKPIPGLVAAAEVTAARKDWGAACDLFHQHALGRAKEIQRVVRVHRDPFEPIMPVLEADSPLGEYRKITEEILRLMPDERRYPRAAAEAVRAFLMLRLGLHLGLRQKNLRELLLCPRGTVPTSERQLELRRRGELRWSERDAGWEVLIPAAAFKNAGSSFFGGRPFRLVLPDLGGLYGWIEAYAARYRAALLNGAPDPGTMFVKTVKRTSRDAAYNQTTFYEAWRLTIQRYGIANPYTGRGAITGLLPHGPHNVRDVLATHILKQTGSYEQASYAIQDTPETVALHYGRFLPQDKAALAAQILNRVWEAA
ncbi:hypothetical protein H7F51_01825 [Novosphingobium flavum]|uniref:Uncharacterized protein n=1 Tax=Novosphingobium flavum TaxID=1778672 RepID=A0A7X1FNW2_9SPHN|nr:hypothetical protein [Novosphingobium flavum]